jgi:TFIIS helical bundle-like domain
MGSDNPIIKQVIPGKTPDKYNAFWGGDSDLSDLEEEVIDFKEPVQTAADVRLPIEEKKRKRITEDPDELVQEEAQLWGEDVEPNQVSEVLSDSEYSSEEDDQSHISLQRNAANKDLNKSKLKKKQSSSSERNRRRRKSGDFETDNSNSGYVESDSVAKVRRTFDAVVRGLGGYSGKGALGSLSGSSSREIANSLYARSDAEADAEMAAIELIKKMGEARESDSLAHQEGTFCVEKLALLPIVEKHLEKSLVADACLRVGLLDVIKSWLEPHKDGTLPSYDVRLKLFEALTKLPVTTPMLCESQIGPLVMFYINCITETQDVKKLAQECVTRWSRPVLSKSDAYRDNRLKEVQVDMRSARPRVAPPLIADIGVNRPISRSGDRSDDDQDDPSQPSQTKYLRARLPAPTPAGYLVRPCSGISLSEVKRIRKARNRMKKDRALGYAGSISNSGGNSGPPGFGPIRGQPGVSLSRFLSKLKNS